MRVNSRKDFLRKNFKDCLVFPHSKLLIASELSIFRAGVSVLGDFNLVIGG